MSNPFEQELDRRTAAPANPFEAELQTRAATPEPLTWGQWGKDLFTGEHRTEFPEAPEFHKALLKGGVRPEDIESLGTFDLTAVNRSGITPDPKAQLGILKKNIPGLEHAADKFGNVMLRAPQFGVADWAYLNKPGVSGRDMEELATQVLATLPLGAAVGLGRSLLARAGIGALASGGASVAQDVGAIVQGSEQGIDPTRAAIATGIGAGAGPVAGWLNDRGMAARAAGPATARQADEIAADLAAHQAMNVAPFGPAMGSGPVAGMAKQVSEFPYLGAPVRARLENSLRDTAAAPETVAGRFGAAQTPEDAGRALQGGVSEALAGARGQVDDLGQALTGGRALSPNDLGRELQQGVNRYVGQGLDQLDPATLRGMQVLDPNPVPGQPPIPRAGGIEPFAPVGRNPNMGQGQAQRVQDADAIRQQLGGGMTTTTAGVLVPARRSNLETYAPRRTVDDLDPSELQALLRAPSHQTSFEAKVEALYERVWRMLPNMFRVDESRNPALLPAHNLRQVLRGMEADVLTGLSGQNVVGGDLANRIRGFASGNFTLRDLRGIVSEIGKAIGDESVLDKIPLSRTQLKQLYAAGKQDTENGIMDLANRAYLRVHSTGADRLTAEEARQADGALRALKVAERYVRAGRERLTRFNGVLRAETPEQAANVILSAAQGQGRGNLDLLRTAYAVLRPEERNDISAMLLQKLGAPPRGATGIARDINYDPGELLRNFHSLSTEARNILFRPQHLQEINSILHQAQRWENVRSLFTIEHPQDLFKAVFAAATDKGQGSIQKIGALNNILTPEEKGDVAAAIIRQMGEPAAHVKGFTGELGYSVGSFMTNWQKMSDEARRVFFSGPHRQALDDLVRVNNRLANVEALANTSRSLSNATGIGTLMTTAGLLGAGSYGAALLPPLAIGAASVFFSRPMYVKWLTGYAQLKAAAAQAPSVVGPALMGHIAKLEAMAVRDPALLPILKSFGLGGEREDKQKPANPPPAQQ